MMADSRWVGYSFLTVRPPGDYFWYLPFYSIHGVDAAYTLPIGENLLRLKAFYGNSDGKIPLADRQWDIKGSPMVGGFLEYQVSSWLIRASYANITFKHDLPIGGLVPAASAEYLSTKNKRTDYYSLGAVYDQGPWQLQLMLNHIEQGNNALESSDGGYVLAGYRIREVTPYLGYSWVRSQARGEVLVVMDADLQHPPEKLPELIVGPETQSSPGSPSLTGRPFSSHNSRCKCSQARPMGTSVASSSGGSANA